ncbi:MAG: hypothetical protein IPN69_12770 [Acidobacteria bacterium]|nr:hypothetical protein [Acidobacteriota bacterium]
MTINNRGRRSVLCIGLIIAVLFCATNCAIEPADISPISNQNAGTDDLNNGAEMIPLTVELLEKKRALWSSKKIRDYQYQLQLDQHGFPIPGIRVSVVDSKAKSIEPIGTTDRRHLGRFENVTNFDDIFNLLVDSKRDGLKVVGQFDNDYGFPTKFRTVDIRIRSINSYTIEDFKITSERR